MSRSICPNDIQWLFKVVVKHVLLFGLIQDSCARVILFRGANKEIKNYNSQTAFQVCVVSKNRNALLCLQRRIAYLLLLHWIVDCC